MDRPVGKYSYRSQEVDMTHHTEPEPTSTPQRQRFRFNIASLVLVVLMLGLWLGWFTRSARIQREAVAAITKARGQVLYDWQWRNGHWASQRQEALGSAMARGCIRNRLLSASVAYVSIPHPSESELSHIGNLGQLRALVITDTLELTDTGLAQLKRLKNLRTLDLRGGVSSHRSVRELEQTLPYLVVNLGY